MTVRIGPLRIANDLPFALIAGPCVIESETLCLDTARFLKSATGRLGIPFIFKASFDKANRSSGRSYRGPGRDEGLRILSEVKRRTGVPVLTDVHSVEDVEAAAPVADVLQIPAFLCRQTDLLLAAARSGRAVNVKKGPFMAPWDAKNIVEKAASAGARGRLLLTERGVSFGYNNLVMDPRAIEIMKSLGVPVVFDATHSVQLPGGLGKSSGGQREFIFPLARAAVAVGVAALFLEVHPAPERALSDGPNALRLKQVPELLKRLRTLDRVAKARGFVRNDFL